MRDYPMARQKIASRNFRLVASKLPGGRLTGGGADRSTVGKFRILILGRVFQAWDSQAGRVKNSLTAIFAIYGCQNREGCDEKIEWRAKFASVGFEWD